MNYELSIPIQIQRDIIEYGEHTRRVIRDFLLLLQRDPRPSSAQQLKPGIYYMMLKNKLCIGWSIEDQTPTGAEGVKVIILGIGHTPGAALGERFGVRGTSTT